MRPIVNRLERIVRNLRDEGYYNNFEHVAEEIEYLSSDLTEIASIICDKLGEVE
jgi:hypothetical protein